MNGWLFFLSVAPIITLAQLPERLNVNLPLISIEYPPDSVLPTSTKSIKLSRDHDSIPIYNPCEDSSWNIHFKEPVIINIDMVKQDFHNAIDSLGFSGEGKIVVRVLFDEEGLYRKHDLRKNEPRIPERIIIQFISRLRIVPYDQPCQPETRGEPDPVWLSVLLRRE